MPFKPERIIWHHTADESPLAQFAKVNEYHKSRGFSVSSLGFYVGYHWFIESDGTVKQARQENEIGAHDAGENYNSIGIGIAGNFSISQPTEAQASAAAALVADIHARLKIPIMRIEPHRWDDQSQCPGNLLPDNWLIVQYLNRHVDPLHRAFLYLGEFLHLL